VKLFVFFLFSLLVSSCASQVQQNDSNFYLGLLSDSETEKIRLFESVLSNPNEYIRRTAAEELAIIMSGGTELSRQTIDRIQREASGWWAAVFNAGSALNRENALSFLLGYEHNTVSYKEARLYLLNECEKQKLIFTEKETAAIGGHHAVAQLRYNDALAFFRNFQEDGKWPAQLPELFFEYPALINDLGRAFVFTQSGSEGLNLYLEWESNLPAEMLNAPDVLMDLRYRLLFYAARVARRIGGQNPQSISIFERALSFAPDWEQHDACIWYILDMSISGASNIFIERLGKYVPEWRRASRYNDLLERFLHKLVSGREWGNIVRTFNLIQNSGAVIPITSYAWVIARLIENNYLSAADLRLAARIADVETADPHVYYRITYNAGIVFSIPSFYYRSLSADALGLPFFDLTAEIELPGEDSQALKFLLGFFENGAAGLSVPYIRLMERDLTPHELRTLAKVLEKEGMYPASMRLASLYIGRDDCINDRRSWELLFPQPYLELTERFAHEYDFTPWLLFGLIRTESAFQSAVVSRAGAVGLMQLMPNTAKDMADRLRRAGGPDYTDPETGVNSTNPELNIHIGSFYLNHLRERLDDTMLALMAYNGGQNRVRRWRTASRLPVDLFVETVTIYETRDYGKRVLGAARVYKELYYSNTDD